MPCFRIHLKASDRFNACISDTLWKVAMDSFQSALIYRNYFLTHRHGAVTMLCMSACMYLLSLGLHAYTYQCVCLRKQHLVSLFYQWTTNAAACSNSHIFTFWISPSIHSPKNSVYLSPVLFGLVTFTLWLYTILSQKIRSICMQDTSTLCPQSVCVCVSLGRLDCWFCPLKLSLVLFFCRRIGSKNTNIHINI